MKKISFLHKVSSFGSMEEVLSYCTKAIDSGQFLLFGNPVTEDIDVFCPVDSKSRYVQASPASYKEGPYGEFNLWPFDKASAKKQIFAFVKKKMKSLQTTDNVVVSGDFNTILKWTKDNQMKKAKWPELAKSLEKFEEGVKRRRGG